MDNLRADAMSEADSESINWDSITGTSTFLSFDSYEIDCENKCIKFSFSYGDSSSSFVFSQFFTYLYIESSVPTEHSLKSSAAEKTAFSIGMATIPWLLMGSVTKKVVIRAADLCDEQLEYWRKCFRGVLAEVSLKEPARLCFYTSLFWTQGDLIVYIPPFTSCRDQLSYDLLALYSLQRYSTENKKITLLFQKATDRQTQLCHCISVHDLFSFAVFVCQQVGHCKPSRPRGSVPSTKQSSTWAFPPPWEPSDSFWEASYLFGHAKWRIFFLSTCARHLTSICIPKSAWWRIGYDFFYLIGFHSSSACTVRGRQRLSYRVWDGKKTVRPSMQWRWHQHCHHFRQHHLHLVMFCLSVPHSCTCYDKLLVNLNAVKQA